MKVPALLFLVLLVVSGVGGKLAFDAYQEREQQKKWEKVLAATSCGVCADRKKDLRRLLDYEAQRSSAETLPE